MRSGTSTALARTIEEIINPDLGRGNRALLDASRGQLARAADTLSDLAARPKARVGVLTGFFIPWAPVPAAETDGPLGAVQVACAAALLGARATVHTDSHCAAVVEAAVRAGVDALEAAGGGDVRLALQVEVRVDDAPARYDEDVLVAIERPGAGADGVPRNMRGHDIGANTPAFDAAYMTSAAHRIGIGDGGNEIGMGSVAHEVVAAAVPLGDLIHARTPCDDLVVAATSNWGGFALTALVAEPDDPWRVLLGAAWSRQVLKAMVAAGSIDGTSGRGECSVDGLAWDDYWRPLQQITDLVLTRSTS